MTELMREAVRLEQAAASVERARCAPGSVVVVRGLSPVVRGLLVHPAAGTPIEYMAPDTARRAVNAARFLYGAHGFEAVRPAEFARRLREAAEDRLEAADAVE